MEDTKKTPSAASKGPSRRKKRTVSPSGPGSEDNDSSEEEESSKPDEEDFGCKDNSDSEGDDISQVSSGPNSKPKRRVPAAQITERTQNNMGVTKKEVNNLKAKVKELKEAIGDLQADLKEKDDEITEMQCDYDDLATKYQESLASNTGKKVDISEKCAAMISHIKKQTKHRLWRRVKFLGDDDQLLVVTEQVLDMWGPKNLRMPAGGLSSLPPDKQTALKIARAEWIQKYAPDIRSATNEQRSYTQSEQKKHALAWMLNDGTNFRDLPSIEDMYLVLQRKLDDDDPERHAYLKELFEWWVVKHVGSVAGCTHFSHNDRKNHPVSSMLVPDSDKKMLAVPASTEAMAFVMYINCFEKWQHMHIWSNVDKKKGEIPKYSSKNHEQTKKWKGKYSDSCNGQSPYGGWEDDGLQKFEDIKKEITVLRKNEADRILEVERALNEKLQADAEAEKAKKRDDDGNSDGDRPKKKAKKSKKKKSMVVISMDED